MNQLFISSSSISSTNDLVSDILRASQTVISMTDDLKNFNNSSSKRRFESNSITSLSLFLNELPTPVSNFTCQSLSELTESQNIQQAPKSQITSHYDGKQTIINFPFTTYTNEQEDIIDTRAEQTKSDVTSYYDGKQTIIYFPFTTYTDEEEEEEVIDTREIQIKSEIASYFDAKQTITTSPFTTYTDKNQDVFESRAEQTKSQMSSYHDGKQTIINFPFTTYTDVNEEMIDTRDNQTNSQDKSYFDGKQTIIYFPFTTYTNEPENEQESEETSTRKYHIKVQDLEYEEFEDFADATQNYKQIKYPYQQNWQRIEQTPEFVLDLISESKKNEVCIQQTPLSDVSFSQDSQIESYLQLSPQQDQRKQAVKFSNYIPKSSFSLLDETACKSQTTSLTASYINSVSYLPYEL